MRQNPHPALIAHPVLFSMDRTGRWEECRAPLYAELGSPQVMSLDGPRPDPVVVGYCTRLVRRGGRHRGKHRIEWTRTLTGEDR